MKYFCMLLCSHNFSPCFLYSCLAFCRVVFLRICIHLKLIGSRMDPCIGCCQGNDLIVADLWSKRRGIWKLNQLCQINCMLGQDKFGIAWRMRVVYPEMSSIRNTMYVIADSSKGVYEFWKCSSERNMRLGKNGAGVSIAAIYGHTDRLRLAHDEMFEFFFFKSLRYALLRISCLVRKI